MYPIYDIQGINQIEESKEGKHVIILIIVKPSDKNANEILDKINYFHHRSDQYCSIYLIGYSIGSTDKYNDTIRINGVDGQEWFYSDSCFIDVCDSLNKRLKYWNYSGEPELIVLQNSDSNLGDRLDFTGYNYIDINYALEKGYMDSFARFMERLLKACKSEVFGEEAIKKANWKRIKYRNVIEYAIELTPKLPKPVKKIMNDRLFYKTYKTKNPNKKNSFYY